MKCVTLVIFARIVTSMKYFLSQFPLLNFRDLILHSCCWHWRVVYIDWNIEIRLNLRNCRSMCKFIQTLHSLTRYSIPICIWNVPDCCFEWWAGVGVVTFHRFRALRITIGTMHCFLHWTKCIYCRLCFTSYNRCIHRNNLDLYTDQ